MTNAFEHYKERGYTLLWRDIPAGTFKFTLLKPRFAEHFRDHNMRVGYYVFDAEIKGDHVEKFGLEDGEKVILNLPVQAAGQKVFLELSRFRLIKEDRVELILHKKNEKYCTVEVFKDLGDLDD